MRRLRILATLTCTATVADAATNAASEKARSGKAILRIAQRHQREMEGRPLWEVVDDD